MTEDKCVICKKRSRAYESQTCGNPECLKKFILYIMEKIEEKHTVEEIE